MNWLLMHAGGTLFREQKGKDVFTPYRRIKGKDFHKAMVEFGECIWHLKPNSKGKMKAENRWSNGVWLGSGDESGDHIIGTEKGTIKVRTVRRKGSEEDRWNSEEFTKLQGTPWEPIPGRPKNN